MLEILSIILIAIIVLAAALFIIKLFTKKNKFKGTLQLQLRRIINTKTPIMAERKQEMKFLNYPGFELFGFLFCTRKDLDNNVVPAKAENFTADFDGTLNDVILGTPETYEDPAFPGIEGTKVFVQIPFKAEGLNPIKIYYDPIIGEPAAQVEIELEVENTPIGDGAQFVPGLRPIEAP